MNIIKVYGGLGNQLFQYAFGRAKQEKGLQVAFNIDWYKKERGVPRPYCLNKFNTDVNIADFNKSRVFVEKGLSKTAVMADGFSFQGYWQSPLYFDFIRDKLINEIKLKDTFKNQYGLDLEKEIKNTNSVCLHVRRGDYLNHPNHLVLPLGYYKTAIDIMLDLKQDCQFFVFSEDIVWTSQNLPSGFHHINGEACIDFELMKLCKHHIIANSTYSWWAAYLSNYKNKLVIAPQKWAKHDKDQDAINQKQLIPENWLKI